MKNLRMNNIYLSGLFNFLPVLKNGAFPFSKFLNVYIDPSV
jgi:hypothetical protein